MDSDSGKISYRRLSGSNPGLRRSRSVRASFRLLGTRWKPPLKKSDQSPPTESSDFVFEQQKQQQQHQHIEHSENLKNNFKRFFHKENQLPPKQITHITDMPQNVAPKAAAILEIPVNCDQFNRSTSAFLLSSEHFKILKRSISLKDEDCGTRMLESKLCLPPVTTKQPPPIPPRTATIRRSSVWANSTLSKSYGCKLKIEKK